MPVDKEIVLGVIYNPIGMYVQLYINIVWIFKYCVLMSPICHDLAIHISTAALFVVMMYVTTLKLLFWLLAETY